jgi:hypothetical protein
MRNIFKKASICFFYSSLLGTIKYAKSEQVKLFSFINGVSSRPHPDKESTGGEDAFYVS